MHLTVDMPSCTPEGYTSFRTSAAPPPTTCTTGLAPLRISGSSQFNAKGLSRLLGALDVPAVTVADLRQESHALVGKSALTFYVGHNSGNAGQGRHALEAHEAHQVRGLRGHRHLTAYLIIGGLFCRTRIDAGEVQREHQLANQAGVGYVRLPMGDGDDAPSAATVDAFLGARRALPRDGWMHFHCLHGHGRTTLLMAMADLLHNHSRLSLEQIVRRQHQMGGADLRRRGGTMAFLRSFRSYCMATCGGADGRSYAAWHKAAT
ncbi:MAG: hypothetical protein EOO40_07205, partial [Deltaproteobacteria bacterium]